MRIVFIEIFTILFFIAYFFGCGGIALNQKIETTENDWTMCGGNPLQQNVAKSVLVPPLILKWSYNIDAGVGCQSITVSDAVVFVNTLNGELHVIDVSSGNKIGYISLLGSEANSSALINGNNLLLTFAGDKNNSMMNYSLMTGEINWAKNLGYIQTSPVMHNGFVYAGNIEGKFYKTSVDKDSVYWSFDANSQIHSTCALSEGKAVFGSDNSSVFCLNTDDGREIWKYKCDASVYSTPMINEEKVFFGSYDSNYYCLSLDSGKVLWKKNLKTKIFSGSSLHEGKIITNGIDGKVYALNSADGNIAWTFETKGTIVSTPLVSGNCVYITSYDWNLYSLDAATGKLLWSYNLDGKAKTSPVIWNKFLFTAADRFVYCFSTDTTKVSVK